MQQEIPAEEIANIIKLYGGWKGEVLSQIRTAIMTVDANITEEVKWKMASRPEGLPVWYCEGIMCLAETFKNDIKLVFTKGAFMKDPKALFNARLQSKTDRAIELHNGDTVDGEGIQGLIREAIALNEAKLRK